MGSGNEQDIISAGWDIETTTTANGVVVTATRMGDESRSPASTSRDEAITFL